MRESVGNIMQGDAQREKKVREFEALLDKFEKKYSLAFFSGITEISPDLYAKFKYEKELDSNTHISQRLKLLDENNPGVLGNYRKMVNITQNIELTLEDQIIFDTRRAAQKDLQEFLPLIGALPNSASDLKARYFRIVKAFGILNKNKIDHL